MAETLPAQPRIHAVGLANIQNTSVKVENQACSKYIDLKTLVQRHTCVK